MQGLQSRFEPFLSKRADLALVLWEEAGIGKSHTASELLRTLPCRHSALHATTPVAALLAHLPPVQALPLWAEATLKRVKQGESVETQALVSTLATWLSHLAPYLLYLEDIHEADIERTALIGTLAQAQGNPLYTLEYLRYLSCQGYLWSDGNA